MPRHAPIIKPRRLNLHLPGDLRAKLDLFLFSEVEARVPHGVYQTFFTRRVKEFFETTELDLGVYLNELPGLFTVRGSPECLLRLKSRLESTHVQP